jgi:glycine/D-amino acid oxidase-like deaminating enzyme
VVCAAGFWGAELAKQVGLVVPLVPMATSTRPPAGSSRSSVGTPI